MEEILRKCWENKLVLVVDTEINLYNPEQSYLIIENHDVLGATVVNSSHYNKYEDFLKYINTISGIKCKIFRDTKDDIEKKKFEMLIGIYNVTSNLLEL